MSLNYSKMLDYKLFNICTEVYPYLEDNGYEDIRCKNQIKEWLYIFFIEIKNIGIKNIYSLQTNKFITVKELVENESFLFYSYEHGTEEQKYIISKKIFDDTINIDILLDDKDSFLLDDKDSFLLVNDNDGIGLGFIYLDSSLYSEISCIESNNFLSLNPSWRNIPD